jgi:TolB-like protein/class 3 adenylate cyclase
MAKGGNRRKLATILAIDAAGYSAQSEQHQERAAESVAALRERAAALAADEGGHIFNTAGDGVMLEFPIASGAVRAAVALAREATAEPEKLPRVRAGVHLGEVIIDGTDRLGHGVNVAARLMQMAPPNGVVISDAVESQLHGEIDVAFVPRGRVRLKKMREIVFAFEHIPGASPQRRHWRRWRMSLLSAGAATALVAATLVGASMLTAPSETPFIAVLPFDNLSGDPNLAYFSDGLSTEIQATLAQYQEGLRVAGLATGFQFRGSQKDPAHVRQAMGATHVVDGSVRRQGDRVRIVAELLDARSGAVLWTENYDRALANTLEIQSTVARQVGHMLRAAAPDVAAPPAQMAPEALEHYLRAVDELDGSDSGPNVDRAVDDLEEATAAAPQFARAWALFSSALSRQSRTRNEAEQATLTQRAGVAAHRALSLDPHLALAEAMLGRIEPEWNWAARQQHYQQALALAPNDVRVLTYWGDFLWRTGRERDMAAVVLQKLRLDPLSRATRLQVDSQMLANGDLTGAIREAERLTAQHDYGRKSLWEAILYNREDANDLPGAQRALRELERMFAGQQNLSDGDRRWLASIRQDVEMLKNGPFREAYIRRAMQAEYDSVTGPDIGQECVANLIPDMASYHRPDLAWRMIETLYIHRGYVGTTDTCAQPVYPDREANIGFVFQDSSGYGRTGLKAILYDPRIWRTFDAVGLTRYWRESNQWPDFCADPHLPYNCPTIAAARRG